MTPDPLSRRAFLGGVVALAVTAACSGDDDDGDQQQGSSTSAPGTERPAVVELSGTAFTLGVASGEPLPDSVVLWTRLAPDPLDGGGMPDKPVEVAWEVAADNTFAEPVRSGVAVAEPAYGHSVHVDVQGLEPDSHYAYRFRLGNGETSAVGVTRTMPAEDASPDRLRFAVTTCQDFAGGSYAAYRHLAAEALDLVVFLGDYIYEFAGSAAGGRPDPSIREHRGGEPVTLEDYRNRHALYRTDPDLQRAHASYPWLLVWDDHDVDNNYAGDVEETASGPTADFRMRRAAAYQAWYEHLPLRIEPPDGPDVRIYQTTNFGDLARFYLLDVRQYGDPPPCRGTSAAVLDTGPSCPEREQPDRTLLGRDQEEWLAGALTAPSARWNVVAQQVMAAGLDISEGNSARAYFLDSWDGHPAARTQLVDLLAGERVTNPVVLTGDYHAAFVADVKPDPFDDASPVVATELIAPAISSGLFATDYTAGNAHIRYFEPRHGYLRCTVEPSRWTAEFRYVTDVRDPEADIETGASFVIENGRPGAVET